ncbi:FAD-dependent oxidoreductase [Allosalinactinospora lopnorensis]|uniref:FAD-dependent oxidoreductase n=1 Tax=Allosalinactinospora lopnorensis TaxID=1352348 RepID=UPI0009E41999|nr:FAD-dependent monooxygenase [Allosalinactinospora lopnorensis]
MAKALIIGGGIAGPVAAIALRKAGIDAVVHEAHDRTAHGIGAFLTFAVNGMDALRALDLDTTVQHLGFDTPAMEFYSGTGKRLGGLRSGAGPSGEISQTVKRADLYAALHEEALRRGVRIEYGKRLADAAATPGGVRAAFTDGTEAEGDLLIGADGLRSRTREIIDPDAPRARYLGLGNAGGFAHEVDVPGDPGVMHMVFGRRCFFCWTKHPNGAVWWFANPPEPTEPTREQLAATTPEQWRARLTDLLAADDSPALRILKATDEIFAGWNTYDFPSVPIWHRGRMALIGDAVHAMSPASGQGASMALEDSVVMAKCLRDLPTAEEAFAAFEGGRRERVERVVAYGKRNGDQKAPGPVGRVLRDLMLPLLFKGMSRKGGEADRWLFGHHIDWEAPVAEPAGHPQARWCPGPGGRGRRAPATPLSAMGPRRLLLRVEPPCGGPGASPYSAAHCSSPPGYRSALDSGARCAHNQPIGC